MARAFIGRAATGLVRSGLSSNMAGNIRNSNTNESCRAITAGNGKMLTAGTARSRIEFFATNPTGGLVWCGMRSNCLGETEPQRDPRTVVLEKRRARVKKKKRNRADVCHGCRVLSRSRKTRRLCFRSVSTLPAHRERNPAPFEDGDLGPKL